MFDRPSNRHSVDGLGEASTDCREPIVAGVSRDKGSVCTSNSSIWFLCVRGWWRWLDNVLEFIDLPTRRSYVVHYYFNVRISYKIPGIWHVNWIDLQYAHCDSHQLRTMYEDAGSTGLIHWTSTVVIRGGGLRNVNFTTRLGVSFRIFLSATSVVFWFQFVLAKI